MIYKVNDCDSPIAAAIRETDSKQKQMTIRLPHPLLTVAAHCPGASSRGDPEALGGAAVLRCHSCPWNHHSLLEMRIVERIPVKFSVFCGRHLSLLSFLQYFLGNENYLSSQDINDIFTF